MFIGSVLDNIQKEAKLDTTQTTTDEQPSYKTVLPTFPNKSFRTFIVPLTRKFWVDKLKNIQGESVNRAILQHCFFLVRQHWGGCRYRNFAANFIEF